MKNNHRNAYILRDGIMNLLSEQEVASVCKAETAERLTDGDEYLDLEQLDQGVCRALKTPTPMGRVLPRKAVHQNTWSKILIQLTTPDFTGVQPVENQESQSTSLTHMTNPQQPTQMCLAAEHDGSLTISRSKEGPAISQDNSCLSAVTPSNKQHD